VTIVVLSITILPVPEFASVKGCNGYRARDQSGHPALEEYVLIAEHKPEVTLYRRSEDWRAQVLIQPDAAAELRSIALTLPLDRIYEGTR
jgi:hypothetical protein